MLLPPPTRGADATALPFRDDMLILRHCQRASYFHEAMLSPYDIAATLIRR